MNESGLDGVLTLLSCPHCAAALDRQAAGVVGCRNGHRFDVARQGYLSLLGKGSRTDTADSADMVRARSDFLDAGHYRAVADAVADRVIAGPVLEIGSGTGYYLAIVLDRLRAESGDPVGLALDASRYAARRAATRPRIGSVVADAWSRLPVRDGAVSTVLSIFAPRVPAEISRVLAPGGRLVAVTPEPDHLAEIRGALKLLTVDPGKPERLVEAFAGHLVPVGTTKLRRTMLLSRDDISTLVRMGPSARHMTADQLGLAVAELSDRTVVTLAVSLSVLEP